MEKNTKTTVTKMEMEILDFICKSDHSTDGEGLHAWINPADFDMKIYRGVLASLVKKEIIEMYAEDDDYAEVKGQSWLEIKEQYQVRNEANTETYFDLVNIECE